MSNIYLEKIAAMNTGEKIGYGTAGASVAGGAGAMVGLQVAANKIQQRYNKFDNNLFSKRISLGLRDAKGYERVARAEARGAKKMEAGVDRLVKKIVPKASRVTNLGLLGGLAYGGYHTATK